MLDVHYILVRSLICLFCDIFFSSQRSSKRFLMGPVPPLRWDFIIFECPEPSLTFSEVHPVSARNWQSKSLESTILTTRIVRHAFRSIPLLKSHMCVPLIYSQLPPQGKLTDCVLHACSEGDDEVTEWVLG